MGLWQVGGEMGSLGRPVLEGCWMERMVKTRVQHVRLRWEGIEVWDICT